MRIETSSPTNAEVCHYCSKKCEPLRCSACKSVQYCSRTCQKSHWKVHKTSCSHNHLDSKRAPAVANSSAHNSTRNAAVELQQLIGQMSMQEAIENFHKATDEVERLKKMAKDEPEHDIDIVNENGYDTNPLRATVTADAIKNPFNSRNSKDDDRILGARTPRTKQKEQVLVESRNERNNSTNPLEPPQLLLEEGYEAQAPNLMSALDYGDWNYTVEKLIYISSFSITLMPEKDKRAPALNLQSEDIDIQISSVESGSEHLPINTKSKKTLLHIFSKENGATLVRMILPCTILGTEAEVMSSLHFDGDFLSFRIQYHDSNSSRVQLDNIIPEQDATLTPCEALTNLQCRSCRQYLLQAPNSLLNLDQGVMAKKDSVIRNVCHLPTGYWDEITDYLTCFDGQPAIDFSAVSNVPGKGVMFEDETILVTNKDDLHNICVLAIDGYGEQSQIEIQASGDEISSSGESNVKQNQGDPEYRGNREWRDTVGGATLTCMLCCSTLGYASVEEPDAYRLLKHRLRASSSIDNKKEHHFIHSTCASFIGKELIRYAESQAVFTFAVFGCQSGKVDNCLLLRVLSWNTSMAIKGVDGILNFRRVVKIVYEETDPAVISATNDDPLAFSWGGVDLCCPPTADNTRSSQETQLSQNGNGTSKSSVNLYLSGDEWKELREIFEENSSFFSETVSKTTVMLKLGEQDADGGSRESIASLSFVPL